MNLVSIKHLIRFRFAIRGVGSTRIIHWVGPFTTNGPPRHHKSQINMVRRTREKNSQQILFSKQILRGKGRSQLGRLRSFWLHTEQRSRPKVDNQRCIREQGPYTKDAKNPPAVDERKQKLLSRVEYREHT